MILDQIREGGLGSDLELEANLDANGEVRLTNLIMFLRAQTYGFRILHFLMGHFEKVEILEQCGEFFKLRVPKEGKTIGWLFGQLEHEKRGLGIEEYSVTQTTLEQIFQNFANQSIASDKAAFTFVPHNESIRLMNPDRKMTEDQERLSQRGLSFHGDNERMISQPPNLDNVAPDQNGNEGNLHDGQLLLPAQNVDRDASSSD